MTVVFVGGSRRISRLNDIVRARLNNIIRQELKVLIGDANGSDKAVQQYLAAKNYKNVVIYCMGDRCRNNIGRWPIRCISSERHEKDFEYYATKDVEMAKKASYGFMIWDGKSRGTVNSILNLLGHHKKVVVYFSPDKAYYTLRSQDDLQDLVVKCGNADRRKIESQLSLAGLRVAEKAQPDLFAGPRE